MRRTKNKDLEEPVINLTPLIDVVFVVLIMFIIIAPILEKDRIELAKNSQDTLKAKIDKTSPISIHINAKNQLFLNKALLSVSQLDEGLKKLKIAYPEAIPQVYYDKKAYFELFEPIKGALEKAGFADMDLILEPAS